MQTLCLFHAYRAGGGSGGLSWGVVLGGLLAKILPTPFLHGFFTVPLKSRPILGGWRDSTQLGV